MAMEARLNVNYISLYLHMDGHAVPGAGQEVFFTFSPAVGKQQGL